MYICFFFSDKTCKAFLAAIKSALFLTGKDGAIKSPTMDETTNITGPELKKCKNCDSIVSGNFCHECGQGTNTERFTSMNMFHEFLHGFLHIEHGLGHTVKELLINPGEVLSGYLHGKRVRYANPFTMIIIFGALTSLLMSKVNMDSLLVDLHITAKDFVNTHSWQYSVQHFSYRILLGIPLYALISRIFYYNKPYNYTEHLITNTFLRAMADLFLVIGATSLIFVHDAKTIVVVKLIVVAIILLYYAWSFAGLFETRISLSGFLKGFACGLLSLVIELFILSFLIMS